jgi:hypothetical protein
MPRLNISSVVDPDPELLAGSGKIISDTDSSGSEMNDKLIQFTMSQQNEFK